jgi:hypothetical protein
VLQVAASTAYERATGAYAMATADFAAIGDCVRAFQTATDCRNNANMAVQNGASAFETQRHMFCFFGRRTL